MARVDPDRYVLPNFYRNRDDGLYFDRSTGDLVLVFNGSVVYRFTASGGPTGLLPSEAAGDLIYRGSADWDRLAVGTAGQVLQVNAGATAPAWVSLSGDATIAAGGAVTVTDVTVGSDAAGDLLYKSSATALARLAKGTAGQALVMNAGATAPSWATIGTDASLAATGALTLANPQKLQVVNKTLNADGTGADGAVVGNSAGQLGHADGVELVAAVAAKIIEPIAVVISVTYATAAYTDGGNITAGYAGGAAATGLVAAAATFGAGASSIQVLRPVSGAALVNTALVARSSAAFTQPGTAAGTATVKTYYRLIDA